MVIRPEPSITCLSPKKASPDLASLRPVFSPFPTKVQVPPLSERKSPSVRRLWATQPEPSTRRKVGIADLGADVLRAIATFLSPRGIAIVARTSRALRDAMTRIPTDISQLFPVPVTDVSGDLKRLAVHLGSTPQIIAPTHLRIRIGSTTSCRRALSLAGTRAGAALRVLQIEGSDFGATSSLDALRTCKSLEVLRLPGLRGLSDISALDCLTKLRVLEIGGDGINNLGPLNKLMMLQELRISPCATLSDLSPLSSLSQLETLHINHSNRLSDLTPLMRLPRLVHLDLAFCTALESHAISALRRGLPNLRPPNTMGCPLLQTTALETQPALQPNAGDDNSTMDDLADGLRALQLQTTDAAPDDDDSRGSPSFASALAVAAPAVTAQVPAATAQPPAKLAPNHNDCTSAETKKPVVATPVSVKKEFNHQVRRAKAEEYLLREYGMDTPQGRIHLRRAYYLYTKAERLFQGARGMAKKLKRLRQRCADTGVRLREDLTPVEALVPAGEGDELEGWTFDSKRGDAHLDAKSGLHSRYIISKDIFSKLYWYQKKAIRWLWRLRASGMGGILGDDMGLGKTVQISSFLGGVFRTTSLLLPLKKTRALIVCPKSVIQQWIKHIQRWCPGVPVAEFSGTKLQRDRVVEASAARGGIVVTTYGMVTVSTESFKSAGKWEYIILDEGHIIRNKSTNRAKAVREVPAAHRIILSGTPLQNKLGDLWALLDFVCKGQLLGDRRQFNTEFDRPITAGQHRNAAPRTKRIAGELITTLRRLYRPHMLRRIKDDVLTSTPRKPVPIVAGTIARASDKAEEKTSLLSEGKGTSSVDTPSSKSLKPVMTAKKTDLAVWTTLSTSQRAIYHAFLSSPEIKAQFCDSKCPLAALTVLKKVCDHPQLLTRRMKLCRSIMQLAPGWQEDNTQSFADEGATLLSDAADKSLPVKAFQTVPSTTSSSSTTDHPTVNPSVPSPEAVAERLINGSNKLRVLIQLLRAHKASGHRTLVFSQSKKMLDLIEKTFSACGIDRSTVSRLDGDVSDRRERAKLVNQFNTDMSRHIFLLTTQVGGLGINLVSANRVVIFDPAWNPASDDQAVDRAYRIGQTRDVVVYRLITCGTLEEVIYRKQVFKGALMRVAVARGSQGRVKVRRHFNKKELREVFSLKDHTSSRTCMQLNRLHRCRLPASESCEGGLGDLLKSKIVFGVSDHSLLFSEAARSGSLLSIKTPQKEPNEHLAADTAGAGFWNVPESTPGAPQPTLNTLPASIPLRTPGESYRKKRERHDDELREAFRQQHLEESKQTSQPLTDAEGAESSCDSVQAQDRSGQPIVNRERESHELKSQLHCEKSDQVPKPSTEAGGAEPSCPSTQSRDESVLSVTNGLRKVTLAE